MSAIIGASHVLCAIGSGTAQVWAAARAGLSRIANSPIRDRHQEGIAMSLVPEPALDDLPPKIDKRPLPPRARRMLRLAAPSLRAVGADLSGSAVLLLGLPRTGEDEAPWLRHVPEYLQRLTGVPLDVEQSRVIPHGRAAAIMALEQALEILQASPSAEVIVGGVDTYLDLRLLATLSHEGRILGPRVMDGFVPGEGAAFYRLSSVGERGGAADAAVAVTGAASVSDPGHRSGPKPARGEGLSAAIDLLRRRMGEPPGRIATTFAGLNGESFDARQWGVARIRHADCFAPDLALEHPADAFGDTGAALGAMLVALGARALASGARHGPALVWAASDHEPCACAVLAAAN